MMGKRFWTRFGTHTVRIEDDRGRCVLYIDHNTSMR